MRSVLFMGDAKGLGVGHAVCCQWILQSRRIGRVTRVRELEEAGVICSSCDPSAGWRGIHETFSLSIVRSAVIGRYNAAWIADQIVRRRGYALLILSCGGVDPIEATSRTGHTLAVRNEIANIQYFDPNFGTLQIDTVQELQALLTGGPAAPGERYAQFNNMKCEIVWV